MEQLPCPTCGGYLERAQSRHGLVWLCRACRAGAVTLPVLRQVAPRTFVNELWQAALHDGRKSRFVCPACAQPFTEFRRAAVHPQIKVCVRCFWVWFSPELVAVLAATPRALAGPPSGAAPAAGAEARRVLGSLGAGVLLGAIERRPRKNPDGVVVTTK